jgi:hypothetical protein
MPLAAIMNKSPSYLPITAPATADPQPVLPKTTLYTITLFLTLLYILFLLATVYIITFNVLKPILSISSITTSQPIQTP